MSDETYDTRRAKQLARDKDFDEQVERNWRAADNVTLRDLREAADKVVNRARDLWIKEQEAANVMVADCAANKTTPPTNYWVPAHKAKRIYLTAVQFREDLR